MKQKLIKEIQKKTREVENQLVEIQKLTKELLAVDDREYWTVKECADFLGCSNNLIYKKVNAGELEVKRINAKILVKRKQIEEINDAYFNIETKGDEDV